mgnify:CR=1 FL=1
MSLEKELNQTKFESIYQKMLLNIVYTADDFNRAMHKVFKQYGLTAPQFNILRILAGASPKPLSPGDIKKVMLFKGSDVTRLLDRLEKKGLLSRVLCPTNRRKMDVAINEKGIALLAEINPKIRQSTEDFHRYKLSETETLQLNTLIEKLRYG